MSAPVQSSCRYRINRAAVVDESCGAWARAAFNARGPESLRAIMGLCQPIKKHSAVALMVTSNRPIEEWGKLLSDMLAASAILDRLLHNAEVVAITGRSYRVQPVPKPATAKITR